MYATKSAETTDAAAPLLSDAIDLGYLDTAQAKFSMTPGGFLELDYKGVNYPRVAVRRSLPLAMPNEYLSLADPEGKEIAILRDLTSLDPGQRGLVEAELNRRYYCPNIIEVKSVKDQLGYVYFELTAQGSGPPSSRMCAVKDVNKNIRMLSDDDVIMFDVDGNRYRIPSLKALSAKSRKRLEPYLF
ncbi:MAG: DUF1854 domain-containing protein [Oscillospiraceae bacterium]|jgi:hypothetical protein|nr:DUF1854 domain-containing protein [Oscillospiraceae bacterium]